MKSSRVDRRGMIPPKRWNRWDLPRNSKKIWNKQILYFSNTIQTDLEFPSWTYHKRTKKFPKILNSRTLSKLREIRWIIGNIRLWQVRVTRLIERTTMLKVWGNRKGQCSRWLGVPDTEIVSYSRSNRQEREGSCSEKQYGFERTKNNKDKSPF